MFNVGVGTTSRSPCFTPIPVRRPLSLYKHVIPDLVAVHLLKAATDTKFEAEDVTKNDVESPKILAQPWQILFVCVPGRVRQAWRCEKSWYQLKKNSYPHKHAECAQF